MGPIDRSIDRSIHRLHSCRITPHPYTHAPIRPDLLNVRARIQHPCRRHGCLLVLLLMTPGLRVFGRRLYMHVSRPHPSINASSRSIDQQDVETSCLSVFCSHFRKICPSSSSSLRRRTKSSLVADGRNNKHESPRRSHPKSHAPKSHSNRSRSSQPHIHANRSNRSNPSHSNEHHPQQQHPNKRSGRRAASSSACEARRPGSAPVWKRNTWGGGAALRSIKPRSRTEVQLPG